MQINRNLIRFAFVAEKYIETGNLNQGLVPLFTPIAQDKLGKKYDPVEFSKEVERLYDIKMHPYAAEAFCPLLVEEGYLVECREFKSDRAIYEYSLPEGFTDAQPIDNDLQEILDGFTDFSKSELKKHGLEVKKSELVSNFTERLISVDFLSIIQKKEIEYSHKLSLKKRSLDEEEPLEDQDIEALMDYLSARYIVNLYSKSESSIEKLVAISNGALLAEVVLSLQSPPKIKDELKGCAIYPDSPFIMGLIGLSGPEVEGYATELFEEMVGSGGEIRTFPHYVEELKDNIRSAIKAHTDGRTPVTYLHRYLSKDSESRAFARLTLDSTASVLKQKGINIETRDYLISKSRHGIFSDEKAVELSGKIGSYHNDIARERDAISLADIIRLRDGSASKSLVESKYIFVTSNTRLARLSRKYLIKEGVLEQDDVPPCVTDRYMAAMLWIMRGGVVNNLSKKQLLVNCAKAISPRPDVINKTREFILKLEPGKAESFEALVAEERIAQKLMDESLGASQLITKDNLDNILEDLRLEAAADIEKEYKDRERKIISSHRKQMDELESQAENSINERLKIEAQRIRALELEKQEANENNLRLLNFPRFNGHQCLTDNKVSYAALQEAKEDLAVYRGIQGKGCPAEPA